MPARGSRWQYLRRAVLQRDDYRCVRCRRRGQALEVDHVVPRYKGGTDEPDNLQALCRTCHILKTRAENRTSEIAGQHEWEEALKHG